MFNELSVLIPAYNTDVAPLAEALHKQALALLLRFEIRIYDDASPDQPIKDANRATLSRLPHVVYKELPENAGRARIRNMLAEEAAFGTLLFIDADSELPDNSYLKTYSKYPTSPPVIVGGTIYSLQKPAPDLMLRWTYGHKRESRGAAARNKEPYHSFTLNNLLIDKQLYLATRLNESIRTYGHEDTAFGEQLQEKGLKVLHIDNPVRHTGLETAEVFLQKTEQAVENLWQLYQADGTGEGSSLIRMYQRLKALGLCAMVAGSFGKIEARVMQNLKSASPNLRLFDLYKLYLICRLDSRAESKP